MEFDAQLCEQTVPAGPETFTYVREITQNCLPKGKIFAWAARLKLRNLQFDVKNATPNSFNNSPNTWQSKHPRVQAGIPTRFVRCTHRAAEMS